MFYQKFGSSKKWLVFLHGWGADQNSFLWLKDCFEDNYSLLFLDFPGFGKSEKFDFKMTLNDYVFRLKEILSRFEIESLTFVAHSFGGRVAIKYLFFYQDFYKQTALCLVDSAGILPRRGFGYWWKVYRFKSLKLKSINNVKIRGKLEKFGSDDYKKLDINMRQTFISIVNEDLTKHARFLRCKTLIVWGNKDRDTKLYMARKFNRLIKDSKLVILKDAGHFCFLEKREDFVIILDSFLKNL